MVVYLPRIEIERLVHHSDHIALHYCAYYEILMGRDKLPEDVGERTIYIPTDQQFTVNALQRMMDSLAREGKL